MLVANNWPPVTASLLFTASVPSRTPDSERVSSPWLRTSSTRPLFCAPSRMSPETDAWRIRLLASAAPVWALFATVEASAARARAAVALVSAPVASACVSYSWLPVTASVLVLVTAPSLSPVSRRVSLPSLRTSRRVPALPMPRRTVPAADASVISLRAVAAVSVTAWLVACNWLPVTASALPAATSPSPTLTRVRLSDALPTDTVLAALAIEPLPSATAPLAVALAA